MKTLLFLLSLVSFAWAGDLKFVTVLVETEWADGRGCSVGEVEVALRETADSFMLWAENGKEYPIRKSSARVISAEDAALMLLRERQELYLERNRLSEALDNATTTAVPVETARDRMRARKAERDAKARQAQDDFIRWKLAEFLSRR